MRVDVKGSDDDHRDGRDALCCCCYCCTLTATIMIIVMVGLLFVVTVVVVAVMMTIARNSGRDNEMRAHALSSCETHELKRREPSCIKADCCKRSTH